MTHAPIARLADTLAERLRAEVAIPTFARAVDELVLNSLDAGASEIVLTIDVPSRSIAVRDNGHGMDRGALGKVGERQSTSKLQTLDQLDGGLRSFGFRGEALHALSAVALVEMVSRPVAPAGAPTLSVVLYQGRRASLGAATEARAPGTTVSVRDLFCNRAVWMLCAIHHGLPAQSTCLSVTHPPISTHQRRGPF